MEEIFNLINFFAYIPGLEYMDDWKKNYRTAFAIFMNFVATSVTTYTLVMTFPAKENVIVVGFFAFNCIVWAKLFVVITKHDQYMSVVQFVFKVVKSNPTGPRERILMGVTELISHHMIVNLIGFWIGFAIYSVFPLYDYFVHGRLTLLSPLLLPLINPETTRGYLMTTFFTVFLVTCCLNVCISTSGLLFTLVDSYDGLVSLIEQDLSEFDDMCKRKNSRENSTRNRDAKMRNIMAELMDISRFSMHLDELYSSISTVQVLVSAVVVVGSLFAILIIKYVNIVGALLSFYTEMAMYCYIGQLLDATNLRIIDVICNCKWYTYDLKHQKDIHIALYLSQNMKPIRLGGMIPLNFETGLLITNKIYTVFMFMLEFTE